MKILISCEHGGNIIPEKYQHFFNNAKGRLDSHEGVDFGALKLAKAFAKKADFFFFTEISRLFIELNRSMGHPKLFSSISKKLSSEEKKEILLHYYFPYRKDVTDTIRKMIDEGEVVVHLSVHSFTPIFEGKERTTDVGLLYDPKRKNEKKFCALWKEKIHNHNDKLKVRFNYPYLGIADGFIPSLRKLFPEDKYIGIELEVNQSKLLDSKQYPIMESILVSSFREALKSVISF